MRKASKTDYGYDSTFPKKLRDIMDSTKTTQAALAAVCGVERQSVAQWRDGNTRPDILSLEKIARYFNVSTDYLLGIEDGTTHDTTKLIDSFGFTETALNALNTLDAKQMQAVNLLLEEHEYSLLGDSFLSACSEYVEWSRLPQDADIRFSLYPEGKISIKSSDGGVILEKETGQQTPGISISVRDMQIYEAMQALRVKSFPTKFKSELKKPSNRLIKKVFKDVQKISKEYDNDPNTET